ncbi:MAG: peptidase and chymotrypsin/Hap [Marmoricola sp.]|nr:peptidase and chymotrypsin/Hap [Marmoricola sp.]
MSNDDPYEPTTPQSPYSGQWPGQGSQPTQPYSPVPPVSQSPSPYPPPYQPPGSYYGQPPASSYQPPTQSYLGSEPSRGRLPGWFWPIVAVMALVLGAGGGALAGALVANDDSPGAVLRVARRTAPPLPADNTSVAAVAAKVLPSTVQIVAEYDGADKGATGSGFVFDRLGHIITNNHVVAEADKDHGPIEIIDQDGNHSKATVVGRSTVYDIAVLQTDAVKKIAPAAVGSADQMRVGETVVAFGSPLGLSATVTSGIISAVNRPVTTGDGTNSNSYINAVQTDAAINPGNSGGPLVNLQGEVVGVNSAIASLGSQISSDQGGNIGVGFAIPIEQVQVTTAQILKTGSAQYPLMGVDVRPTTSLDGATVETITPGLPAAKTDLKIGDVIRKIDGKRVTGSIDLVVAVRSHVPGEKVTLTVERGSRTFKILVGLDSKTG